jgi:hypothetical protein
MIRHRPWRQRVARQYGGGSSGGRRSGSSVADETFAQFEQRVTHFADDLQNAWARAVAEKAGVAAKKAATAAASADLGGDPKFSGWKPELVTRFDHLHPGLISFHPTKGSAGPWTVAEFGRHQSAGPHLIGVKLTKSGKVSKGKGKRWNGRTAGKHTASEALAKIDRQTPDIVDREFKVVLRKFFD